MRFFIKYFYLLIFLTQCSTSFAASICTLDIDNSGYIDQKNEIANCEPCIEKIVSCENEEGAMNNCVEQFKPCENICPLSINSACVNLDDNPIISYEIPTIMETNDGERDDDGFCIDSPLIFTGSKNTCRINGVRTFFMNCCKETNKVYHDSSSAFSAIDTVGVVKGTYQAASIAYSAYKAGATMAEITASVSNSFIGAFDPTTLILSLVVSEVFESCNQVDMNTSLLKSSDQCVYVGNYCDSSIPILNICVQKAKSYCCFNSKIAKIIQEQGRKFLNKSWGNIEYPDCSGLTPEEFQSIDFSVIDLSDYYNDLEWQSKELIKNSINSIVDEYDKKLNY